MKYFNIINNTFHNIILFLTIFSIGYQDFFLKKYIGEIGRSPIILLFPLFLLYNLIKQTKIDKTKSYFFFLFLIPILTSSYFYLYTIITNYSYIEFSTIIKTIKLSLYFFVILNLFIFLTNQNTLKLMKYTFYTTIIYSIIFIIEVVYLKVLNNPTAFSLIHISDEYWRVRLLTAEASWAGLVYIIYISISIYYLKNFVKQNRFYLYIMYLLLVSFLYFSSSKGLLILYPLVILIAILFNKKISLIYKIIIIILMIFALIIFIKPILFNLFLSDIEAFSSVAVRSSSIITSIFMIIENPFGYGFGFHKIFMEFSFKYIDLIQQKIDIHGFNTVLSLIENNNETYTIKSGILKYIVITGLFGVFILKKIYYVYKFKLNIISNHKGFFFLETAFYFMILSIIFYLDFLIKYEIVLLLSVIYKVCKNERNKLYLHRY